MQPRMEITCILYRGQIDGAFVLVYRQVDDYAIATADPATAEKLISFINRRVTTRVPRYRSAL
jgi:hypothetical protein